MNQSPLVEDEGVKVHACFAGPDTKTSLTVLMEPFQFGGIHMMCCVTHFTIHATHTMNWEFVF